MNQKKESGGAKPHTQRSSGLSPQRVRKNSGATQKKRPGGNYRKPHKKGPSQFKKTVGNRPHHTKKAAIPPLEKNTLRIIPIGGCEEVGRNCFVFEYERDIVILDMGLQFPEEDMPGIDYIIPNLSYLKGREKDVKGVVFTHGHLDHIGAAPFLLSQLNYPTIISRDLTLALIKHKQEDFQKGSSKKLKVIRVNNLKQKVTLGKITLSFFQVEHSIMDSMGVCVHTPAGTAIHPGDWTMERDKDGITQIRYDQLASVPGPKVLLLESLGALSDQRHGTYEEMYDNIYGILRSAPGRIIVGTFSSQVERVKWIIYAAAKLGKKVALDGYSMKINVEIVRKLGYVKPPKGVLIDIKKIKDYPDNKVVVLCTGAQGEQNAVLMRIVNKVHRHVELTKHDTIIFSSSIIPGNERTIQRLKDNIYRQCDNVIHGDVMDVHISGHSTKRDILEFISQTKPDYFVPVFGNHFFLKEAKNLAVRNGFPEKNTIVPDNGTIMDMTKKGIKVHKQKVNTDYVFVDGLGISDMQHVVLRDRQVLAEDGMVVVIATVDTKTGKLVQNPDIISRGFVFLKDNRKLIEDVRRKVRELVVESDPRSWADTNQIRNDIRDKIGKHLFVKTEKRPMILPVVIEV